VQPGPGVLCATDPTGSGGLRAGGGYGTERADVCLEVATVTEEAVSSASASGSGSGWASASPGSVASAAGSMASTSASGSVSGRGGGGQRRSLMVCGGDGRVMAALVTRGHRVRVQLHNPRMVNAVGMFLLRYNGQFRSFGSVM